MKYEVEVDMSIFHTFEVEADTEDEAIELVDGLIYELPLTEWEWGDRQDFVNWEEDV